MIEKEIKTIEYLANQVGLTIDKIEDIIDEEETEK